MIPQIARQRNGGQNRACIEAFFVREWLDNPERAEHANRWYLVPRLAKMKAIIEL